MTGLEHATDLIRQSVSALDAGRALGLQPDSHGRCACPAHKGKDRNCRLYTGTRGYYCFVCHAGGDVIELTQKTLDVPFKEAVEWLSGAFHLGVDIHKPVDKETLRRAEMAAKRRKELADREEAEKRADYILYLNVCSVVRMLEDWMNRYAPLTPEDWIDKRYAIAAKHLPELRELLNEAEDMVSGRK